ncbi:MAG: C13 family peptidase [Lysobacterales bacterium]
MWALLRTLGAGLLLTFGVRPAAALRVRPASHFWFVLLLAVTVSVGRDRFLQSGDLDFYLDGLQSDAFGALLVLAAATLIGSWSGQRVMTWSMAVLASAAGLWISLALIGVRLGLQELEQWDDQAQWLLVVASCTWWLLVLLRIVGFCLPDWRWWKRSGAATIAGVLTTAPFFLINPSAYWYPSYESETMAYSDADAAPARRLHGSAEALIYRQPQMIADAVSALRPGVPGQTDAYLLAFGADANEDVFRNEVSYAQTLFAERFGMQGRTLTLLNNPDTTEQLPLANLSNLKLALAGMATRMDPDEDLLVLFLTTHGSADHELYVDLQPLALDGIRPGDLREALDAAGIHWRVIVVSACYSGGFLDDLASPMSLVMTAARRDRPSFGCGDDSELTYFGRALLVEALNQTRSFTAAFELARESVHERELADDFEASEPQMQVGALIGQKLDAWTRSLAPAEPVAFVPEVGKSTCGREDQACAARTHPGR